MLFLGVLAAEAVGDDALLPVIGGVMLVTFCALALGLTLGRRQKKPRRKPRRNPFEAPAQDAPTEHPEV